MTILELIQAIHLRLKYECFTDIVDKTGVSSSTVSRWRKGPPEHPSLSVFVALALFCGFNPSASEMEPLLASYKKRRNQ